MCSRVWWVRWIDILISGFIGAVKGKRLLVNASLMIWWSFVELRWAWFPWLGIALINFGLLRVYLLILIRVACFCVVLILILNCTFFMLSTVGKGSCRLGILVFLLLLQSFVLMIVWSLWTVSWLKLGVWWTALFHMRVDFNFSIPSFLFIFSKAIIVKITSLLRSFLWNGSDLSSGNAKVAWIQFVCLRRRGV
jgi:hypothetical protein